MTETLNLRQEKFCQNLILGMNQREAYRDAYNPDSSEATIDVDASQLLRNPKIVARLDELKTKIEGKTIMDSKEKQELLTKIARDDENRRRDQIEAIKEHNKMVGDYIPARIEVEGHFIHFTPEDLEKANREIYQTKQEEQEFIAENSVVDPTTH